MDVVVQLRKVNSQNVPLSSLNFPALVPSSAAPLAETAQTFGPQGFLRASASASASRDETRCSADGQEIFYKHDSVEKITPGAKIPLDITFWPMGMVFAPGEGVMLRVAGRFLSEPPVDAMRPAAADDENVGLHWIHTGSEFDSHLTLPIVGVGRS